MLVNITILLSKLPKKRLKQMNFYRRIKAITSTHQLTNTPGILPGNDYAIILCRLAEHSKCQFLCRNLTGEQFNKNTEFLYVSRIPA